MRFPAKKNAVCPKAPHDFAPRKDGILHPRPVVLGPSSPSPVTVRAGGLRTLTSQSKFFGSIGYQISLPMVLRYKRSFETED